MAMADNARLDVQAGTPGDDKVQLGDGDDAYDAGEGDDEVRGGGGDDLLIGGGGDDRLFGEAGDDSFEGGGGDDLLDGGPGSDTVLYTANTRAVRIDLEAQLARFPQQRSPAERLISIENAATGAGDDVLLGNAGANVLRGLGGDDAFYGRGGDDSFDGGSGDDYFHGGAGSDTVIYAGNRRPVAVDLADQVVRFPEQRSPSERMVSIENAVTGSGDDILVGNRGDNRFTAGDGADRLSGGRGHDALFGEAGDDRLDGGRGDDRIEGGAGGDRLAGGPGNDRLDGGSGIDRFDGGSGNDTLVYDFGNMPELGSDTLAVDLRTGTAVLRNQADEVTWSETLRNVENLSFAGGMATEVFGDAGANVIRTAGGTNRVDAGAGDDVIHANGNVETLIGGAGDDVIFNKGNTGDYDYNLPFGEDRLFGGAGDDVLHAGWGEIEMAGGAGADEFVFTTHVVEEWGSGPGYDYAERASIEDFDRGEGDKLVLKLVDGYEAPVFVGETAELDPGELGYVRGSDSVAIRFLLYEHPAPTSDQEPYDVALEISLRNASFAPDEGDFLFV
jgi:Ca2+-binding RTX toxin-like protein